MMKFEKANDAVKQSVRRFVEDAAAAGALKYDASDFAADLGRFDLGDVSIVSGAASRNSERSATPRRGVAATRRRDVFSFRASEHPFPRRRRDPAFRFAPPRFLPAASPRPGFSFRASAFSPRGAAATRLFDSRLRVFSPRRRRDPKPTQVEQILAIDADVFVTHVPQAGASTLTNWTGVGFSECGYVGRFVRTMVTKRLAEGRPVKNWLFDNPRQFNRANKDGPVGLEH